MSRCIFLLAGIFAFVLGYAQCPDSVRVYVYPEVICPGEVVHLSTDSTRLHCVNIGDIICVHNVSYDTVIVSPSDWTLLGLASSYSPLSVVFFVDSTCRHGWAVQAKTEPYEKKYWYVKNPQHRFDVTSLLNYNNNMREALSDLNGFNNSIILTTQNTDYTQDKYPAVTSAKNQEPFYLPAIGQLNFLYPNTFCINTLCINYVLEEILLQQQIPTGPWWSSTESNDKTAFALENDEIVTSNKHSSCYVLPVMNF